MENNAYSKYINNLNTFTDFEITLNDKLDFYENQNDKIDDKYFTAKFINKIDENIFKNIKKQDDQIKLELKIFLKLIDVSKDMIYGNVIKYGSIYLHNFITLMIDDPYMCSKKYKLRLSIEKLDEIYKILHDNFNNNMDIRMIYILGKVFKDGYMDKMLFWNLMNEKYKITSINILKHIYDKDENYIIFSKYYEYEKEIVTFFKQLINVNKIEIENNVILTDLFLRDSTFIY